MGQSFKEIIFALLAYGFVFDLLASNRERFFVPVSGVRVLVQ
jgi:hypothetical protein